MASDVVKDLEGGKTRFLQANVPPGTSTAPVKRLTKIEKARLEALSAFGNCPFDSLVVRRESFKSKLNATAKNSASGKDTTRKLTRMQKARLEANEAFKNIKLGQKRKARIEEKKTGMPPVAENAKRRLTRLEKCNLEVKSAFSNVALDEIRGNKENSGVKRIQTARKDVKSIGRESLEQIKKGKRKSISKGSLNRRSTSRRRSSAVMRRRSSTKGKRLTKVQVAQLEALQSFGGQGLDNVWKSHKNIIVSACTEKTEPTITEEMETDTRKPVVFSEGVVSKDECQMTADSLEVGMVTYDANDTCQQDVDMVDEAVPNDKAAKLSSEPYCQLVDRSTQVYKDNDKETSSEVQVQNDSITSPCEHHMHGTKGMSPIPAQSLQQSSAQSSNMQFSSTTPVEPKPLTRLERARLEALQSFHGQALDQMMKSSSRKMAKYLTPVKHQGTNTEANPTTRNTPSQTEDSHCRRHPRPKSSFYTNLGDKSFCDRDALLESSKIVVLTARSLDTPSPNCSPANAVNP